MVLERIRAGLGKRKVKVFLIFLCLSALSWLVSNLSKTFVSKASFNLAYTNVPKDFQLSSAPKKSVYVKLRAVGFQFLGIALKERTVYIDLSKISKKDTSYYIAPNVYRRQIEKQLPTSMEVMDMDRDTLFFDLTRVITKKVPVVPRINYTLENNYALENGMEISPKMVQVRGPRAEIDTITHVRTALLELGALKNGIQNELALVKPKELQHTTFQPSTVKLRAAVFRFSEKIVSIPVTTINLPDQVEIRTFPETVPVLCRGKIEDLKALENASFLVSADFAQAADNTVNILPLRLQKFPETLIEAKLMAHEVEFILRKK